MLFLLLSRYHSCGCKWTTRCHVAIRGMSGAPSGPAQVPGKSDGIRGASYQYSQGSSLFSV